VEWGTFIGHFVTIAFESRFVSFRVAFDFQFALWHFLCVYGIDKIAHTETHTDRDTHSILI